LGEVTDILVDLAIQQAKAVQDRDRFWTAHFDGVEAPPAVRMVTVPEIGAAMGGGNPSPGAAVVRVHPAPPSVVADVVSILKGALNQPSVGAVRPMLRSAIERLEGLL
jgi:hypothetical protein